MLPREVEELSAVAVFAAKFPNLLRFSRIDGGILAMVALQRVVVVLFVEIPSPSAPELFVQVFLQ